MDSKILNVLLLTQWSLTARRYVNDCGPTCIAMLLAFYDLLGDTTVDQLSGETALIYGDNGLSPAQITELGIFNGLDLRIETNMTTQRIIDHITAGRPLIPLIAYRFIPERQDQNDRVAGRDGHYIVVNGYDASGNFIVNDPDRLSGNSYGHNLTIKATELDNAIAGVYPQRTCIVCYGKVDNEVVRPAYVNTSGSINLRLTPDGPAIASIPGKAPVWVLKGGVVQTATRSWTRVQFDRSIGWVASDLISDTVPETPHQMYVNAPDKLHLRAEANSNSASSVMLAYRTVVNVQPIAPVQANGLTWVKVSSPFGDGWVAAKYLSPLTPSVSVPTLVTQVGYGPHFMGGWDTSRVKNMRYPIFKSVDNADALIAAHESNPTSILIYRNYGYHTGGPEAYIDQSGGIDSAVQRWVTDMMPQLQKLPFAYHESFNESGMSAKYLAFEAARTRKLKALGYKACIVNVSSGTTEPFMWTAAKDAVQATIECGGAVGVHAYAEAFIPANYASSYWDDNGWHGEQWPSVFDQVNAWTFFRPLLDAKALRAQGQANARIVITESGCDQMSSPTNGIKRPFGINTGGWKSCIPVWTRMGWLNNTSPEAFYKKQLDYAVSVFRHEPIVNGFVVFTAGTNNDPQWNDYDCTSIM